MPEKRDEKLLLIFAGYLFFHSILLLGKRPFVYCICGHTFNAHVSCVIRILRKKNIPFFPLFQNSNIHFGMEKESVKQSNELKHSDHLRKMTGKKARNETKTATATSGLKPINYINKIVLKTILLIPSHWALSIRTTFHRSFDNGRCFLCSKPKFNPKMNYFLWQSYCSTLNFIDFCRF